MVDSRSENSAIHGIATSKSSGFTLIEILMVLAIIAALAAIAYPMYNNYLNKAKITLGISTLETVRKSIEVYHTETVTYPPTIDMTTGTDGQGIVVLPEALLNEFKRNLFSFESYVTANDTFTLTAKATDAKHTLLVLTPSQVVQQGP